MIRERQAINYPHNLPLVYLSYFLAEEGKLRYSMGFCVVCGLGFEQVL